MLSIFCYSNEENGHYACMNGHLTTANQSEIREAYLVLVGLKQCDFLYDGGQNH